MTLIRRGFLSLIFIFLIITLSCTSNSIVRKESNTLYQISNMEEYLLSDIPSWINFVTNAGCFRSSKMRFFNLPIVRQKLGLDFESSLQFQLSYNYHQAKLKAEKKTDQLSMDDETFLFFNSFELILGGKKEFKVPQFKRVHLIEVDQMISKNNQSDVQKLAKLLTTKTMNLGHPILVTYCHSRWDVEQFIEKSALKNLDMDFRILSQELSSHYNPDFKAIPRFEFYYRELFPGKNLYLFRLSDKDPLKTHIKLK